MTADAPMPSVDLDALLHAAVDADDLLIIQDLDGVCMPLVRDPLTRVMGPAYIEAVARLDGQFYVLTNGEHIGRRGVNGIVERALGSADTARARAAYLPGLAAGGVQLQDRQGVVSHPGVDDDELAFLADAPARMQAGLTRLLSQPDFGLDAQDAAKLAAAAVLDNPVSPTINLNGLRSGLHQPSRDLPHLQRATLELLESLQADAAAAGMADSFFIHLAPNRGRDDSGSERLAPADATGSGTTDFQFMLTGAVKEAGVLVLLNQHVHRRSGRYPLGQGFNVRQAPRSVDALVALARDCFDADTMPRIIGVGDTVTSTPDAHTPGAYWRGGSDRGFLTLVQRLGEVFGSGNRTVFVDSSGGELDRSGVDPEALAAAGDGGQRLPVSALAGITDPDDPLRLDAVIPGGPAQYTAWFDQLARARTAGR